MKEQHYKERESSAVPPCKTLAATGLLDCREAPDPKQLAGLVDASCQSAVTMRIMQRMMEAHETRIAYWPRKTGDGKRWPGGVIGELNESPNDPCFPWPGAPDTENRTAEELIHEFTDLNMAAFLAADLQIHPLRGGASDDGSAKRAATWKQVAGYYLDQGEGSLFDEAQALSDTAYEYGFGILGVGWEERFKIVERTLPADAVWQALQNAAMEATLQEVMGEGDEPLAPTPQQQQLAQERAAQTFAALMVDPELRAGLAATVRMLDPEMPEEEARRVARGLQKGQPEVTYYARTMDISRPCWRNYIPFVDVWFDPTLESFDKARWICTAEWLTDVDVRARADAEGWDAEWTEEFLEYCRGTRHDFGGISGLPGWVGGYDMGLGVADELVETEPESGIYQVFTMYSRLTAKGGVPMSYRTVFHPSRKGYGKHETLSSLKGRLPFVAMKEGRRRVLALNEGIPKVLAAHQTEMKGYHDAFAAQTQLRAVPPIKLPAGDATAFRMMPGATVPTGRVAAAGIGEALQIPAVGPEFEQLENRVLLKVQRYYGIGPAVDPEVKLARRRVRIGKFLMAMKEVIRLTFLLIQENTDALEAEYIGGTKVDLNVEARDLQGEFDLKLSFDVADLDLENTAKRLEFIQRLLLPIDSEGVLQRAALVRAGVRMVMPDMVDQIVAPVEDVRLSEVEDEDTVVAKMAVGIESMFKLGQNHKLRADRLEELMQTSPVLPVFYQQNPVFKALMDQRLKMHRHQVEQQQNAVIGRVGGDNNVLGGGGE